MYTQWINHMLSLHSIRCRLHPVLTSSLSTFTRMASAPETVVPQTDVPRPSALPTARLRKHQSQSLISQNSSEYLDGIEEEWNKRVDVEIETLVDGMVDIVSLAAVRPPSLLAAYTRDIE